MAIKSYHSSVVTGRGKPLPTVEQGERLVGVEFETSLERRDEAIAAVEEVFGESGFCAEQDGSLPSSTGVEFVGDAVAARLMLTPEVSPLWKLINAIAPFKETSLSSANIGMHVNVAADDASHSGKVALVGSAWAVRATNVGGRPPGYSRAFGPNGEFDVLATDSGAVVPNKGYIVAERYSSEGISSSRRDVSFRNEFRCHRSFVDWNKAQVQVAWSVMLSEFVRSQMEEMNFVTHEISMRPSNGPYVHVVPGRFKSASGSIISVTSGLLNLSTKFDEYLKKSADMSDLTKRVWIAQRYGIRSTEFLKECNNAPTKTFEIPRAA